MMILFPKQKEKKKRKRHNASIMQDKGSHTCYLCELLDHSSRYYAVLHEHHIFGGANRIHSEEEGLKVYLCPEHHLFGEKAVHNCKETMELLHRLGQMAYEQNHTRQQFIQLFGKNYLEDQ